MSDTLRDQLLGLGFKPAPKPEKPARPEQGKGADSASRRPHQNKPHQSRPHQSGPRPNENKPGQNKPGQARPHQNRPNPNGPGQNKPNQGRPNQGRPSHGKPRSQEEIDLAKAYAIRAQKEKDERIEAERLKQEEARKRREAKAKLAEVLKDKALNDPNADIARHFDYGGKIKRVYVNAEQLKSLNAGELGVVQLDGRYLLVVAALLTEAEAIFAPAVALKVDPNAPAGDDPYADPQYQVPDDLVW